MGKRSCFVLMGLLCASVVWAEIPGTHPAMLKKCEARVDEAMDAYNSRSWKDFFKDFASASAALRTEQSFQSVYVDTAQKEFGNYESRTLDDSRCTFNKSVGLLIYKSKFSKKWASLSANFLNEGGDWKLQQVRIDP